jgi:nicotinamide-nucleotide amidase
MNDAAVSVQRGPVRAGILVTGTEVLTGLISDRNGPWLSERLRELGVDVALIEIVGDRPDDLSVALEQMASAQIDLIVTSGGLGPTADDLTAEVVAEFCGRPMVLDKDLEARIEAIVRPALSRWPDADVTALIAANRKQALIPEGATVLDPQGTAPGLVVAPLREGRRPTIVVLPGPPGELQPMWKDAIETDLFRRATAAATVYLTETLRLYGMPEAEIAGSLREGAANGLSLERLEITTCLRRGEIEVTTRFEPDSRGEYEALVEFLAARHGRKLFSRDGSTIDEQVAAALLARGDTIAAAESCTGGLLTARLTERPGSSAYVGGASVVYSNSAKSDVVDVDPLMIAEFGAVSIEVAEALALGVRRRFSTSVGVGITGVAGPGGGTEAKPVGYVCFAAAHGAAGGESDLRVISRAVNLPGSRSAVRERATTVAMHLLAELVGDGEA